jgi:hypothetical protein
MKDKQNKAKMISVAKKMVADKKAILDYSNGKISKKELRDRGIKLTMPI